MKIYLVYDYDEDGPDELFGALTPDGILKAIDKYLNRFDYDSEEKETATKLANDFLADDKIGEYELHSGWGGLVLRVIEAID